MLTRLAHEVFDGFTSKKLEYVPPDPAYIACNPSVHFDGATWRCIVRCINYRLGSHIPERPNTQNVMLVLDDHNSIASAHPITDRTGHAKSGYPISGYEDCRLFQWKDKLWASATTCHLSQKGDRELVLLELDSEYAFVDCIPLRGPWSAFYQKNWIPCPVGDTLRFVYSLDRSLVIGITPSGQPGAYAMDRGNVRHASEIDWRAVGNHRGSSACLVLAGGQRIVLAHMEGYQSRFVLVDPEYRITHKTETFNFTKSNEVEFAVGMAYDKQQLVVSYSVRDASVELGMFPLESVMQKMERIA